MKIGLIGASFDTGNMGVSALAESTMKIILNRWPDAEILFLKSGRVPRQQDLVIMGRQVSVTKLPIRFSKNIFLPCHFLSFVFYGLLAKVLPRSRAKDALLNRNPHFRALYEMDLAFDITGGDSFSDIYGFGKFFGVFLCKWLIILLGKKLILLPQTYGPFERPITRKMATYILSRADVVYSRDHAGVEYVRKLLNIHAENRKCRFAPDVAFILDSCKPEDFDATFLSKVTSTNTLVVGLNISGLLFNGALTQGNVFRLKVNYRDLVYEVIEMLLKQENVIILLIPHVFPPIGLEVESDPDACLQVYNNLKEKFRQRIFLTDGEYNQNELKYIIGLCDFFIGSRMHSCIAALSQGVPAIGLAYSKKFHGVFQTIGAERFVVDMRQKRPEEILEILATAFEQRKASTEYLGTIIPRVQEQVRTMFKGIL